MSYFKKVLEDYKRFISQLKCLPEDFYIDFLKDPRLSVHRYKGIFKPIAWFVVLVFCTIVTIMAIAVLPFVILLILIIGIPLSNLRFSVECRGLKSFWKKYVYDGGEG